MVDETICPLPPWTLPRKLPWICPRTLPQILPRKLPRKLPWACPRTLPCDNAAEIVTDVAADVAFLHMNKAVDVLPRILDIAERTRPWTWSWACPWQSAAISAVCYMEGRVTPRQYPWSAAACHSSSVRGYIYIENIQLIYSRGSRATSVHKSQKFRVRVFLQKSLAFRLGYFFVTEIT